MKTTTVATGTTPTLDRYPARPYALAGIGAAIVVALGVAFSLKLGFASDDPAAAPVPGWQFGTVWTMVVVGLVALAVAVPNWWKRTESGRAKLVVAILGGAALILGGVPMLMTAALWATS